MRGRRGFGLPDGLTLRCYLLCGAAMDLLFFAIYYSMQWLSARRSDVHHVYFNWELSVPLVPWMIVIYLSMFILFIVPLFKVSASEMKTLFKQIACATLLAGLIFLLFPSVSGFHRYVPAGYFAPYFKFLYQIDMAAYNAFPSLHVIYSGLILMSLRDMSNGYEKYLYMLWLILIVLSTIFVHQHHLADIIGGLAVVWICRMSLPHDDVREEGIRNSREVEN